MSEGEDFLYGGNTQWKGMYSGEFLTWNLMYATSFTWHELSSASQIMTHQGRLLQPMLTSTSSEIIKYWQIYQKAFCNTCF